MNELHDDDLFTATELEPVTLDRSTVERYATCPFQGWAVETGMVVDCSPEADTGTEVHRVISEAVDGYAMNGEPPRDYLEQEVLSTRPDIQSDCLWALRPSIWAIDNFLTSRHPNDIIAYQGGPREWTNPDTHEAANRNSQLAWEILPATSERGPIILTSELDLLLAGTTETELEEIDFKSGRTTWTSDAVKSSFQFRMHNWLVMRNYPGCEYLHVTVWMTRMNMRTPRVTFTRKAADDFEGLLLQAVEYRRQALEAEGQKPLCWPGVEKCQRCPAILKCHRGIAPAEEIARDPIEFARDTLVLEKARATRLEALRSWVEKHGEIKDGNGLAFGLNRPRKVTKPKVTEYVFYDDPEPQGEPEGQHIADPLVAAVDEAISKPTPETTN